MVPIMAIGTIDKTKKTIIIEYVMNTWMESLFDYSILFFSFFNPLQKKYA